jgi:hypothetical protein
VTVTVARRVLLAAGLPAPDALATTLLARMTVASVIVMMTVTAVTLATARDLLTAGKPLSIGLTNLNYTEGDADIADIVTATIGTGTTGTTAIAVRTERTAMTASVSIEPAWIRPATR